jgi:uncharacterized protein (TIGR03435 family)
MTLHASRISAGLVSVAVAFLILTPLARGQVKHEGPTKAIALAATLPPYDVVSIKLHNSANDPMDQQSATMSISDDIFTATNMPLESIIEFAYDVREDMISGLSGPVSSARFDIEAKVLAADDGKPPKLTDTKLEAMIVTLLADRFHLKLHLQPKVMPTYDLVLQHGEPKFKLSQAESTGSNINMNQSNNDKVLTAKSATMTDLALALSDDVHRLVVDKTGLAGTADISLKWTADEAADQGGTVVSIFTAVQEQLGLKLQSSKGPVDTLVIDHVEMPSQN